MASTPLVSIKITSYNYGVYLARTIESVLSQTYRNFEIIIVDDSSRDNSVEIINSFKDDRIHLLINEVNIGAAASSKKVRPMCRGKYFCSLDSDDYFAPDKLEKQVDFMESNPDVDLVATHVTEVDGAGNFPENAVHELWFNEDIDLNNAETWIWGNHICHSSVLMKKALAAQLWDYDCGLTYTPDWYNWIRFFCHGAKFAMMPERLTFYRYHGENITHKDPSRKYWETVYIYSRLLFPYLIMINRPDLIIRAIRNMICQENYPVDVAQRNFVINLLLDYSREFRDFEDMMKYTSSSGTCAYLQHESVWQTSLKELLKGLRTHGAVACPALSPESELQEISAALAMTTRTSASARYSKKPESPAGEFRPEVNADVTAKLLWLELLRAAWENVAASRGLTIAEQDQQLAANAAQLVELNQSLVRHGEQTEEFRNELEEKNDKLAERDQQLAERDQQLAERDQQLAERDQQLAASAAQLVELNKSLVRHREQTEECRKELKEKNDKLAERDRQLAANAAQLVELNKSLVRHKEQIHEIFNSGGWRTTVFFRTAVRSIGKMTEALLSKLRPRIVNKPYKVRKLRPYNNDRPRIAHALANFMTGGSSRLVIDLIEHLGHLYEQEIITSYVPDPPAYSGATVHEFRDRGNHNDILAYFRKFKPDIIHIHYWGDCDYNWYHEVFQAAEKTGCKIVENINTPVEPYISDAVSHYVYVSKYVYETFGHSERNSSIVYPGSDFELFVRQKEDIPDECIGMVYRLESDKLDEKAIEVFIKVAQRRPGTKVLIVGGGTFLEIYRKAVHEAGVSRSFVFTKYVPYNSLPKYYERMSIFVAPVWNESFGQVSSFAMNMGIPVAGYNVGALSEILGNEELLAPPGDSDRLVEIVIGLLNDRAKRLSIGKLNRKRAQDSFSVEAMVERYASIYKDLTAGRCTDAPGPAK
ncbi:MAG: glycosyltransferase [Nitrospirae bacterium]|nr:glycosyltransferase [Nitrospirota bacterium]